MLKKTITLFTIGILSVSSLSLNIKGVADTGLLEDYSLHNHFKATASTNIQNAIIKVEYSPGLPIVNIPIEGLPGQWGWEVFDQVTWVAKNYPGYIITDSEVPNHQFDSNDSTVQEWELSIEPTITARYVDINGKSISDEVATHGKPGEKYTTEQKDIPGYTFKEVQGNPTGQFTDKAQTITYVYTKDKVKGADVTVKYIDTDGKKISDDVVKTGNVGDDYNSEQKDIVGYTFKEVQGNPTGQFTDKAQTITYVYTKDKANTVNPESKQENKPDLKDKNNNQGITLSEQHGLPATGESERMTMMSIILGVVLLALGVVVSIFRFKNINK